MEGWGLGHGSQMGAGGCRVQMGATDGPRWEQGQIGRWGQDGSRGQMVVWGQMGVVPDGRARGQMGRTRVHTTCIGGNKT